VRSLIKGILFILLMESMGIDSYLNAQSNADKKDTVIITKLKLNTKDAEYSPYLFDKKLYFVSNRQTEVGVVAVDKNFNVPSKIFEAERKDSLKFNSIKVVDDINGTLNGGPVAIGKNGIYYTATSKILSKRSNLETPLRIFFAAFNPDSSFQTPLELDLKLPDSVTICHPALLNDSVLYFTYYALGSISATDLYYSTKQNERWTYPTRCPFPINTEKNEEFPFLLKNQLYFSSNREEGKGGLDIYSISLKDTFMIVNKEEELNTEKDDFGIFLNDSRSGYFSSNRNGNDDIYYFYRRYKPIFEECKEQLRNSYCYTLKEKDSYDNNDTLNMFYEWSFGDGTKANGMVADHCYEGEGIYRVELNVIEKKSGETFLNELSYDLEVKNEKQLFIYSYDTLASKSKAEFSAEYSNIENYTIENYYWDFGDGKYYEGMKQSFTFKKAGKYNVRLLTKGTLNSVETNFCIYKRIEVFDGFKMDQNKPKIKPMYKDQSELKK